MKNILKKTIQYYKLNGLKSTIKKIIYSYFKEFIILDQNKQKYVEIKNLIGALDINEAQYKANFELLKKYANKKVDMKTINWFIPRFEHVLYGGIFTIFRFADYFNRKGIKNRIIIYDDSTVSETQTREAIKKGFKDLANECEIVIYNGNLNDIPECDASISTFWTSAFFNLKFNKTKKKFYFIQDYEPMFYAANTMYAFAEMTYRFGFKAIVNTPGLKEVLCKKHDIECESFVPSIDFSVYNISDKEIEEKLKKEKIRIVTYGRPNHERNAFELSLGALKVIKQKYGEKVEIFSVGAEWNEKDYGVEGLIKNLGKLNSLKEVADLYKTCDIGLVFMFTPHPSYQPFEYMGCGCNVVTNYNSANLWLLKNSENCILVEPTITLVANGIEKLIENKKLRNDLINNGLKILSQNTWEDECEKIYRFINK